VSKVLSKFVQSYTIYALIFLLYVAVFIFTGFFFHIYINHWSLVAAFASYSAIGVVYLSVRHADKEKLLLFLAGVIVTPLIFWGLATVFGNTYDTSYDGQDYHQSAVIELSNGWNPIYEKSLPIKLTNRIDKPLDSGYGKIIWSIDSSIYKLTHNIDSATVINLIIGLLSFSFFYRALKSLGLDTYPSIITTFLTVVTTLYVEQVFTFREDALSYEFVIIGIASLVLLLKNSSKLPYFLCLLTTFVFLAGTKDSNLFIFLPLLVMSAYMVIERKWYRLNSFKLTVGLGLIIGFITLFSPYITNIIRYHAIDYPYNQASFSDPVMNVNVPLNLSKDGRLKLFFYGVFSSAEIGNEQDPASNNAHLKAPFTFTANELVTEASAPAKYVGGYGVLFSGIFILSIASYLYLALRRKSKTEKMIFAWLSVVLGLIIISCLSSPVPNYARYGSQLDLFPISIAVALLLIAGKKWKLERIFGVLIIVLLSVNITLDILTASLLNVQEFNSINAQLSSLKNSNETYLVHANIFYSNYIQIESHGVKSVISQEPIKCNRMIILADSADSTELCKL